MTTIGENSQRNFIVNGLTEADNEDLILISDVDEIPNLQNLDFSKINKKIIMFKQEMFYYKFNLKLPNFSWVGTKACKKKNLKSPQWFRNQRVKNYPFYRFNKIKWNIIENGGWHFSFIMTPNAIKDKIKSFAHGEFNKEKIVNEENIKLRIQKGEDVFERGYDLKIVEIDSTFPEYIFKNKDKLKQWIA